MAHITSNAATDDVFATWINKKFVSDLEFSLQHQKFTMAATMPEGYGANIARFVDFAPPSNTSVGVAGYGTGSTALTEATPTGGQITSITTNPTNVTISEYGEFIQIGQLYEYAAVGGTRARLSKRLLDGGLISIDAVVRAQANLSTSALYALTTMAGANTTIPVILSVAPLGAAALVQGKRTLFANLATGFRGVPGHPEGHYSAILTPKQEADIVTEVTTGRIFWNNCVVQVPGSDGQLKFVNGYIGSIYRMACYITQSFLTGTVSNVAAAQGEIGYLYADGGVAAATFEDMRPRVIINDVNSPYKNVNSIAWHSYFGAGLIDSRRVIKLYSVV